MVKLILLYMYIDVTECWNNDNNNENDKVSKLMQGVFAKYSIGNFFKE